MFTREIKGFGRESRRVERASYDYNLRLVRVVDATRKGGCG